MANRCDAHDVIFAVLRLDTDSSLDLSRKLVKFGDAKQRKRLIS